MAISAVILNTLSSNNGANRSQEGRIRRSVLSPQGRTKLNLKSDREFYSHPRFVTHVDDNFISTLKNVYREKLRPNTEILDLMSSWVSHLPEEVKYKRVIGHGLNAQELARNPQLDYFFVKDLNSDQKLELGSGSLDAVLCTVSVQYMQQPEKVFAEIYRVLREGGVVIVSFSNRMFYEKAVAAWRDASPHGRTQLVVQYFQAVDGFTQPQVAKIIPSTEMGPGVGFPSLKWIQKALGLLSPSDPFYSVIAYKNFTHSTLL